jgi:hypothetical protein
MKRESRRWIAPVALVEFRGRTNKGERTNKGGTNEGVRSRRDEKRNCNLDS